MFVATCRRHQAWHAPNADGVAERKFSAIPGMANGTYGDTGGQTLGICYARIAGCQRCNVSGSACFHCFRVIARFRIRFESILTSVMIIKNWDLRSQPAPVPIHIVEQEVVSPIILRHDWSFCSLFGLNISRFYSWGGPSNLFLLPRFAGSIVEDTVEASDDGKLIQE